MPNSEQELNTGELADEMLGQLTVLEELVRDIEAGREVYPEQIDRAVENLEDAQGNANEILRRFEETVGPI